MTELSPQPSEASQGKDLQPLITVSHAVYLLQAIGLFLPLTFIAGIIVNNVKREDVEGTWLASHFSWQIQTFWYGLLWAALGGLTFIVIIGWFILFAVWVWILYRVIKGWLYLVDRKPLHGEPRVNAGIGNE